MHDIKERLSVLWIFALLNYLYADVFALFDIVGSHDPAPHFPAGAMLGFAVLMEIPIAMILASRLLPFRANRLANIIAGVIETLAVISMQFVYPLASGAWHEHICLHRTFSSGRSKRYAPQSSSGRRGLGQRLKPPLVRSGSSANRQLGSLLLNCGIAQKCIRTIRVFGAHRADRERQGR